MKSMVMSAPPFESVRGVPLLGRVQRIHVRAVDDPVAAADVPPESLGRLTGEALVLAHIAGQVADGGGFVLVLSEPGDEGGHEVVLSVVIGDTGLVRGGVGLVGR